MTKRFAVLGHPVAHSLSPAMHTAAFRAAGLDATYEAIDVAPGSLSDALRDLVRDGFSGASVTVPHKETVLALLDHVEPSAKAIGAVNTLLIDGEKIVGTNTDARGFARSLEEAGVGIAGCRAVVLGAGGAARAVVYALAESHAGHVTVLARQSPKAQSLVRALKPHTNATVLDHGSFEDNSVTAFENADLVFQATSATMERSGDAIVFACSLPLDALPETAVVMDIVYRPRITTVLEAAKTRGLRVVDGLGMLLHQGTEAFERWTGKPAPTQEMRRALESAL